MKCIILDEITYKNDYKNYEIYTLTIGCPHRYYAIINSCKECYHRELNYCNYKQQSEIVINDLDIIHPDCKLNDCCPKCKKGMLSSALDENSIICCFNCGRYGEQLL